LSFGHQNHVGLRQSGYRSAIGSSLLKTYSSVACNVTLAHDKSALGCPKLSSILLNLNQGSSTWCPRGPGRPYGTCGSPTGLFEQQHKHEQCLHIDKYL